MKRAVFLDRDGILLDHTGIVIAGAKAILDTLKAAGFSLIVVTNQPDITTGKLRQDATDRIHHALRRVLPLDDIVVCPHVDSDDCKCRKPKPGMLLEAKGIDFARSFMVGDRWRDVGAGKAAGCTTILVGTGYGEMLPVLPDHRAADLETAARIILETA